VAPDSVNKRSTAAVYPETALTVSICAFPVQYVAFGCFAEPYLFEFERSTQDLTSSRVPDKAQQIAAQEAFIKQGKAQRGAQCRKPSLLHPHKQVRS
jgi:hypothetical protein